MQTNSSAYLKAIEFIRSPCNPLCVPDRLEGFRTGSPEMVWHWRRKGKLHPHTAHGNKGVRKASWRFMGRWKIYRHGAHKILCQEPQRVSDIHSKGFEYHTAPLLHESQYLRKGHAQNPQKFHINAHWQWEHKYQFYPGAGGAYRRADNLWELLLQPQALPPDSTGNGTRACTQYISCSQLFSKKQGRFEDKKRRESQQNQGFPMF